MSASLSNHHAAVEIDEHGVATVTIREALLREKERLEQERKAILEWLRNSPQINIIHAVYRGCKGRRDLSETRK